MQETFSFQEIPQVYNSSKNSIDDPNLVNIYSKFNFNYLIFQNNEDESRKNIINFLHKFKFITYQIIPKPENKTKLSSNTNADIPSSDICNAVICVEKQCLIIESIQKYQLEEIFKEIKSLIIDLSNKDISDEITSFCTYFKDKIRKNSFLKLTIKPIAMYIIRRFFCPTNYFNDPTFFTFDPKTKETFDFSQLNCDKMIQKVKSDKQEIKNELNKIDEFNENDFIELRTVYLNNNSVYYLVLHIKKLYIFLMKKLINSSEKLAEREIDFCQKYQHRCFTKFYGFIKKNSEVNCLIYEFMSNDTLQSYITNMENKVDEIFTFMTLIRIIEGIEYLHSYNLIYRDLKPLNILIDHDFIPYLSDFETIRENNQEEIDEFTQALGSCLYTSPEQNKGWYSYPTDIYSLGAVIYFIYERKHLFAHGSIETIQNNDLPKANNVPISFKDLYERCVQNNPEKRPTIQEFVNKMFLYCKSFYFLELPFMKKIINSNQNKIISQYFEEMYFLLFISHDEIDIKKHKVQLFQILNLIENVDIPSLLFSVGKLYYDGQVIDQDYVKAKEYFEISALQNNSDAQTNLGKIYHFGKGVDKDYLKAIEFYEFAAVQDHSDALNNLAVMHIQGLGVKRNVYKAIEYFEAAAKLNNRFSMENLGKLYTTGIYGPRDIQKGIDYYNAAIKLNSSVALLNLGVLYKKGTIIKQDYKKAIECYEKAAKLNNTHALYNLALMYLEGAGVKQDYSKVVEYCELAAKQDDLESCHLLGKLYYDGTGVEQNYYKAKKYCEIASKKNDPEIFFNLGNMYYHGEGTERDYSKAKEYFEKAGNYNYSDALNTLGIIYNYGKGVETNYQKAKEYYELAAKSSNTDAFINLGNLYYNGHGVIKNFYKAKEYYELAANRKSGHAFKSLGNLYFSSKGIKIDYKIAKEYFEMAAKLNNSDAIVNLGNIYLNGLGVNKNIAKAKEYFEQAAKLHNPHSLFLLGSFYHFGLDVEQNYEKARDYYELALKNYSSKAINSLGELYLDGKGTQKDFEMARKLFNFGVELENDIALYHLAGIYKKGNDLVKDYLLAKYYYELSAKLGNSNALYKLGKMYFNGLGVEKNVNQAIECFESSAKMNNHQSLYQLGLIYLNGQGVEQNYTKAKKYFDLSASLNNVNACFQIGLIYYYGLGVIKDYLEAKNYFEISSEKNNLNSVFYLGKLFEKGSNIIHHDINKAIQYFTKCASNKETKYILKTNYSEFDEKRIFNKFYYPANNDLGLIYLFEKDIFNFELALKYIKEAGLNEYPFGQNSLGLLNKYFLLNGVENARYMFEKASKSNFVLSYFNLGKLYEDEKKIEEYVNCYVKASELENEQFIFRNQLIEDERLEISKSFIVCYINFKLAHYYFYSNDQIKSIKFTIKAIFRPLFYLLFNLTSNSYRFNFESSINNEEFSVKNLSDLILNNPMFHFFVRDEFNADCTSLKSWEIEKQDSFINVELKLPISENERKGFENNENSQDNTKMNEEEFIKNIEKGKNNWISIDENSINQLNEEILNIFNYMNKQNNFEIITENCEYKDIGIITIKSKNENIKRNLLYPKILAKLLIDNINNTMNEIEGILDEMNKVLFKPPYEILFGRINIYSIDQEMNRSLTSQNINESFYEGFND